VNPGEWTTTRWIVAYVAVLVVIELLAVIR
jgi:hypothetical protein